LKYQTVASAIFLSLMLLVTGVNGYKDLEYYVTDDAGVLLLQDIYDIEELCVEVEYNTGAQIAVYIVNSTAPDDIDTFTVKTFEESGIGRKDHDDGLLLVIAVGDNTWRIEVGYGLEGVLPDIKVNEIARDHLVPYLTEGYYYEAALYTVAELGWIIVENYTGDPPGLDDGPSYPISFIPLNWWQLLIAISITVVIFILTGGRLLIWIGGSMGGGGRGGFSGGRSGGGGSSGGF
jgi:uncharacterized protein